MALFQTGEFTLASGASSTFKIECDALTPEDWAGLAQMAVEMLPPFGIVEGVPRGGIPFADALRKHSKGCSLGYYHMAHDWCEGYPLPRLIAEDVVTTGGSIVRFAESLGPTLNGNIGIAAFARGELPNWVKAVFYYGGKR